MRLFAFLRAINVGGHTVTMAELRGQFEKLGFRGVETFIASGNVTFQSNAKSTAALEKKIEKRLQDALGFEVATFIRTGPELVAIANHAAFPAALCVGFLARPLPPAARAALAGLKTSTDDFHVHRREVYWICKTKQHESKFNNVRFEKTTGAKVTFRSTTTVAKLAVKAAAGVPERR